MYVALVTAALQKVPFVPVPGFQLLDGIWWSYQIHTLTGKVLGGMKLTPCGGYMVYPLGSILVVRSLTGKNKQAFLEGHTSEISCIAMSSDGTRIVSGQVCILCVWFPGAG